MKKHSESRLRRFGRKVGMPFTAFMVITTALSNFGAWISARQQDSTAAQGKMPYEAPTFHVFSGMFIGDANAAGPPPDPDPPPSEDPI